MTHSLRLELPAVPASVSAARRAVAALARRLECDVDAVRIAVTEAFGNSVLHAYSEISHGPVVVLARVLRGRLVVTVADRGRGMTPGTGTRGWGMGLPLASKLAGDVRIRSDERGAAISMGFDCSGATSAPRPRSADLDAELDRAREFLGRGFASGRASRLTRRRRRPTSSGRPGSGPSRRVARSS